jgi:hypothetical protein
LAIDLVAGATRQLAALPGPSLGLAATGERVYVSRSDGSEVRALDARSGRLVQTLRVGRHPLGLAHGRAGDG